MTIAISDDHLELAGVATAFLERTGARAEARALLDAPEESLPAAWKEMADLGWLGLHLPEEPDPGRRRVAGLDVPHPPGPPRRLSEPASKHLASPRW